MSANKPFHKLTDAHSDIYTKSILAKLKKVTPEELESDGIVMSPELMAGLPEVEMKYLLDNIIPPDELLKIDDIQDSMDSLDLVLNAGTCEYCHKPRTSDDELCCVSQEIQAYLSKCEDKKLLKQFSSYSLNGSNSKAIQTSLESIKRLSESEKLSQQKKSLISLTKYQENLKRKRRVEGSDQFKTANFDKHKGTLLRIKNKLENIRRFCPEIYNTDESIIAWWARSSYPNVTDKIVLDNTQRG